MRQIHDGNLFPIYVILPDGAAEESQSLTRQSGRAEEMRWSLSLPCSNYTALQEGTTDKIFLTPESKFLFIYFLITLSTCHSSDSLFLQKNFKQSI